ncbi:MAG: magnesium/cobalt transporter CorA [Candidatus Hydrogenedentota bacterium]
MIHSYWWDGSKVHQNIPPAEWKSIIDGDKGLLWIDMEDPIEDEIDYLSDIFDFHTLSIEDCILPVHRPKIDDFDDYIFVIFHAMAVKNTLTRAEDLDILELNLYIGAHYIVSFHEDVIPLMNHVRSRCSMQPSLMTKGSDFLLHLLMDSVVDETTHILQRLEEKLDVIEDNILADKEGSIAEINEFKSIVSKVRKIVVPQLDVVRLLMNKSFSFISDHQVIYFRDIYDHLMTVNDTTHLFREVIASTLDSYLSMLSKKLNDVMKVLTVMTIIFMPLNLIASIYGMNFDVMPELRWEQGYYMVLLVMATIVLAQVWLFRKLKWF